MLEHLTPADLNPVSMATISTRHLSPAAIAYLDRDGGDGSLEHLDMVEDHSDADSPTRLFVPFAGDHFWLDRGGYSIVAVPYRFGWFVFAHDAFDGTDADEVPPELARIIIACNRLGFTWIKFDSETSPTPALPIYEEASDA